MSHSILIFVISVWTSILGITSGDAANSFLNQQAYSDQQYEDDYDINDYKRLRDSSILNRLSNENLYYAPEDDYPQQSPLGQHVMNDNMLEDDYTQQVPIKQIVVNDYAPKNDYSYFQDSSNEKISNNRRSFYPKKIPFSNLPVFNTPYLGLAKCTFCIMCYKVQWQSSQPSPPSPRPPPPPLSPVITTTRRPPPSTPAVKVQNITTIAPPSNSLHITTVNLLVIHRIRDNILSILGCLLQRPIDFLTEPQYSTLHMLFIELRNRPSIMQFVIPHLQYIPKTDLTLQLVSIMQILSKVLPCYVSYAARFWVRELQKKNIDLKSLFPVTCSNDFNILQGVNLDIIKNQVNMEPFGDLTALTKLILGPLFVKLLYDIQKFNVVFIQELFGIMLINFPLIPYNPVLDENIRFIFEVTRQRQIRLWKEIKLQPVTAAPHKFIQNIIAQILIFPNIPRQIKEALTYIRIHLMPTPVTHINPDYLIMQRVHKYELNIKLLLSFIVPGAFNPEAICLKNRLLGYIQQGRVRATWMITEKDGLQYSNPHDLLLAFLARLQRKTSNPHDEIARTVTALLSILVMDKQNKQFSPIPQNIEIFTILGYFNNPEFGSSVINISESIITTLISKPDLQITISQLIPVQTGKCIVAEVCWRETLSKLHQLDPRIPYEVENVMSQLNRIIPLKSINPECKDTSLTVIPITPITDKYVITTHPSIIYHPTEGIGFNNVTVKFNNSIKHRGSSQILKVNINLVNVIMLSPMLHANQDLTIYITDKGAPVVDYPNITSFPGNPKVTMPPLTVLLKPPEITDSFGSMSSDFKTNILEPLTQTVGSAILTVIFGTSVQDLIISGKCPTTAALTVTLLEKAKLNPLVKLNHQLLISIKTFLSGLDLFAVITLPIVLRVAKVNPKNGILYSVISISKPHKSIISVTPPKNIPQGMLVFVIVDPNKLKEPVNPQNPYDGLLPNIGTDTIGGVFIQELKVIFTKSRIAQLLPNFKPEGYINKGFLLMVILQKLSNVPAIVAKPQLKKIIRGYILAILIPAFYTKVSYTEILKLIDKQPQVKPDTSLLLELLPSPKNAREKQLLTVMQKLLKREDLFDSLIIPNPTPNTSRIELLKMIIRGVLQSKPKFDSSTVTACIYFNNKVFDIKKGSLPIDWEMKEVQIIKFKVHLGQLIENVIPYDELSIKKKLAYNDLMEYFRINPKIFRLINDFPFKNYKTEGTFIKGMFKFLLKKSIISQAAKKNIKALLPLVNLNGPGAKPLKSPKSSSGRRSESQLEITL